ncbi:hypothetical protein [Flavobacterium sp.]|uniref:hypothetical protein n=1 Tax=Flavobacterium sp. TaxID=239 RepID=UPI00260ED78A|nr:hypothetical protein [Flavobacterium sp.]
MNNDNELKNLFDTLNGHWDNEEPAFGHENRFLAKLEGKQKKKRNRLATTFAPVAATIALMLGIWFIYIQSPAKDETIGKLPPKVAQTQEYFALVIEKELAKVENENSPETRQLVKDALYRMSVLEKDYEKLTEELLKKGENKKIIHAMITNLQTRISFLEEVLIQIENIKKIKDNYNENNNI